jgi:hypothetical protein
MGHSYFWKSLSRLGAGVGNDLEWTSQSVSTPRRFFFFRQGRGDHGDLD